MLQNNLKSELLERLNYYKDNVECARQVERGVHYKGKVYPITLDP